MMCGGAKKTPKALPKKMAKGGSTANKLNNARGFAPAQKGGSNTKMMIYGIPNAGMTSPNRNSQTETMKKGGAKKATTKKPLMKKGGSVKKALTKAQTGRAMTSGPFDKATTDYLNTKYPGTAVRIPRDPEYYAEPESHSYYTPMAELEADDRRRTEAYIRSANNREDFNAGSMGYRRGGAKKAMMKKGGAVKKKMATGGAKFPDLTGDGKVTRADILKARGVDIKKKGGATKASIGKRKPGRIIKKVIIKKK